MCCFCHSITFGQHQREYAKLILFDIRWPPKMQLGSGQIGICPQNDKLTPRSSGSRGAIGKRRKISKNLPPTLSYTICFKVAVLIWKFTGCVQFFGGCWWYYSFVGEWVLRQHEQRILIVWAAADCSCCDAVEQFNHWAAEHQKFIKAGGNTSDTSVAYFVFFRT